jgi:hypothetical protein
MLKAWIQRARVSSLFGGLGVLGSVGVDLGLEGKRRGIHEKKGMYIIMKAQM